MAAAKTILVTGVAGFVGGHLAKALKEQGHTVIGTGQDERLPVKTARFVDSYIGSSDLTQDEDVRDLPLDKIDAVINLAGLSQMGASFENEAEYLRINVEVHTCIAKRLLTIGRQGVTVLAISSGAVYDSRQPMPLSESAKLAKNGSPYSKSKIAMEEAMKGFRDLGLNVVIARPFNHIGPGQLEGFLVPDLSKQVMAGNKVVAGDLTTERDYTDVRDVVQAYIKLVTTSNLPEYIYNVCSGISVSGQKILDEIVRVTGKNNLVVEKDPSRIRPNDPRSVVGNGERLRNDTGWKPTISLSQTIEDFIASLER